MPWRFWKPLHTVQSVAMQLAEGLKNGSDVLDEPFADDLNNPDELYLQIDFPAGTSDAEILNLVQKCAVTVDKEHRDHGGHGLKLDQVQIDSAVRVAMRPNSEADAPEFLEAAISDLQREQPHVHVLAKPTR